MARNIAERSRANTVKVVREVEDDNDDQARYLPKPQQRSHSVSPELRQRIVKSSTSTMSGKDAGAVDEEQFRAAFNDYKRVTFSSPSEVEKALMDIQAVLSNNTQDWEKRVDELKRFRGYIAAGAAEYKEFFMAMRYMDMALQTSARDLRSQVVRESCISIAFLAATLGLRCERTAEMILPTLILLIPNSAKVMATSGQVAIRLLLTYVHSPKLIPIITHECLSSKSKEIRRACCEFVKICLSTFPKSVLERHVGGLRETIKKTMSDADSETRSVAREAYAAFAVIFPAQGGDLFKELDVPKQRLLSDAGVVPATSLTTTPAAFKARPVLKSTTTEDFGRTMKTPVGRVAQSNFVTPSQRSISAVDAGAARRARARLFPQTSQQDPAIKPTFSRGGPVAPLQRSIRRDIGEKRVLSSQKKAPAGPLTGMERTGEGDGQEERDIDSLVSQLVTDIPSIVALLGSSNWLTKRDGLLNLRQYFRQGKSLLPSELELVRSSFARLITDPSTKMAGIVIDTLYDFVRIHNLQIGSWLYQLLTKLWTRQATDTVTVVQTKLERLLLLIRSSFPAEVQFQHVMRFLTELSPTSAAKLKLVVLDYLTALIRTVPMQPDDLKNSSVTRLGTTKIISWSSDSRFPGEVRQSSQLVLVLLNQLNCKVFVDIIDTLEQDIQQAAIRLISNYQDFPVSVAKEEGTLRNIHSTPLKGTLPRKSISSAVDDRVNSFSREASAKLAVGSQRVLANDENANPVSRGLNRSNGSPALHRNANAVPATGASPVPDRIQDSTEEQVLYLTTWSAKFLSSERSQQCQLLESLHAVLQVIKEDVWEEHFMTVLPFLYDLLHKANNDSEITAGTLVCFADLLHLTPVQMRQFPELTIVNLLEVQGSASKAVAKACEECLRLAVHVFDCSVIVKILSAVIANQPSPENAAAVQLFALMCRETRDKSALVPTLPLIVPLLVSAYAHSSESTMRKECVYGLIYAQLAVGEEVMAPYYEDLPQSKLRLMNVYLKRLVQE